MNVAGELFGRVAANLNIAGELILDTRGLWRQRRRGANRALPYNLLYDFSLLLLVPNLWGGIGEELLSVEYVFRRKGGETHFSIESDDDSISLWVWLPY